MKKTKRKIAPPKIYNLIIEVIQTLPSFALQEVLDYSLFIKQQHNNEDTEMLQVAETALAKDWLKPEEDEAWKNL